MISELLEEIKRKGVKLHLDENRQLKAIGAAKDLEPSFIQALKDNKSEIIDWLSREMGESRPTITARPHAPEMPVSMAQQRLWIIDQLNEGSPEYNMPGALKIDGTFDIDIAEKVLRQIIERHATLRTVFAERETGPVQIPMQAFDFSLARHDLSALNEADKPTALQTIIKQDREKVFDLKTDLMFRASYVYLQKQEGKSEGILLFNTHHIASDGWSMNILIAEFGELYLALSQGKSNPLKPLEIEYADYALWQRDGMQGEKVLQSQFQYWDKQLENIPPVHSLELDGARPVKKQYTGACVEGSLDAEIAGQLKRTAKHFKMTPFMMVHSALAVLLSRYSNANDIVVGTPVANRMQPEVQPLIGFFMNMLVLRVDTHNRSVSDYLEHVRHVHVKALDNQEVPFDKLVERLNVPRDNSHTPLFQIMLNIDNDFGQLKDNNPETQALPSNATFSFMPQKELPAKYDLNVVVGFGDEGIRVKWVYDTNIFSQERIALMNTHFQRLLTEFAKLADESTSEQGMELSSLSMLTDDETDYLLQSLQSEPLAKIEQQQGIYQQILAQATSTPEAIAFEDETGELSYKQLLQKANGLAKQLTDAGIQSGDTVAILAELDIPSMVGIIGVLAAGAVYLPLDPEQPLERLNYMVDNASAKGLVTTKNRSAQAQVIEPKLPVFEYENIVDTDVLPAFNTDTSQAAYIIYTSGSTGKPKAVVVSHANLLSFVAGFVARHDFTGQRLLMIPPPFFDASVGDIFPALVSGSTLILHPKPAEIGANELLKLCEEQHITAIDAPAAMWSRWTDDLGAKGTAQPLLPTLKMVMFGGEPVKLTQVRRFAQLTGNRIQLCNHYGPTETTVCATMATTVDASEYSGTEMPIGTPLPGVKVYLLDANMQLVPPGRNGEIYIGGVGVSDGYIGLTEKTQQQFVIDPFSSEPNALMYKTNDFGQWNDDGTLQFNGRIDDQVKIRGFRIELGEIEQALISLETVRQAAVVTRENSSKDKYIVAYIAPVRSDSGNIEPIEIINSTRQSLKEKLPTYMLPAEFMLLDELPLTPNGKVNKKALPEPEGTLSQAAYVAPETATEQALCEIWKEILDVSKIGGNDNFFDLGGHSLSLTRLVTRINTDFDISLEIKLAFSMPTIKETAVYIDALMLNKKNAEKQTDKSDDSMEEGVF